VTAELIGDITWFMNFHNYQRRLSKIGYVSPIDLEPQRIGDGAGDQRFLQSRSLAVSKNTMASES